MNGPPHLMSLCFHGGLVSLRMRVWTSRTLLRSQISKYYAKVGRCFLILWNPKIPRGYRPERTKVLLHYFAFAFNASFLREKRQDCYEWVSGLHLFFKGRLKECIGIPFPKRRTHTRLVVHGNSGKQGKSPNVGILLFFSLSSNAQKNE